MNDFVKDFLQDCGDEGMGNPLLNVSNMYTRDSSLFQDAWNNQHPHALDHPNNIIGAEYYNPDSPLNPEIGDDLAINPIMANQADPYLMTSLTSHFHNFVSNEDASIALEIPDLNLPVEVQQKISSRAEALAHQLHPNHDLAHMKLHSLFSSLNIEHNCENEGALVSIGNRHKDWIQGFEEVSSQRNEWDNIFNGGKMQSWDNIYENQNNNMRNWDAIYDQSSKNADFMAGWETYKNKTVNDSAKEQEFRMLAKEKKDAIEKGKHWAETDFEKVQNVPRSEDWARDFSGNQNIRSQEMVNEFTRTPLSTAEEWANDFSTSSFWNNWNKLIDDIGNITPQNTPFSYEKYKPYVFSEDNPYLSHSDPLAEAKELFDNGNLSESILAFEAGLSKDMTNSEAWCNLGRAQAENDRDDLAVSVLRQAIEADPSNLEAYQLISVSYTNDMQFNLVFESLLSWLNHNPLYTNLSHDFDLIGNRQIDQENVTDLFISAAHLNMEDPDPEIQVCLGLLYNLSSNFHLAEDCFKTAVRKKPNDYQLWNKLGATQANSRDEATKEEALDSYCRALERKPTFTRARSNLGIAFMSRGNYEEAAKCFLGALTINDSEHFWVNLTRVFRRMKRNDLVNLCTYRDIEVFRQYFVF
eukprot:TRINITY_DN2296_c0_g1_i3.p1 TRINITY_DN2296_c0_g1~~TRINITY_DN2296_c0_g1_i3.p1  ORF type:complete len:640 (-),score=145.62 TRINITY_DN2296_c0_g1_i3:30-1949(-)